MKKLILLFLMLLAAPAHAQVVSQGHGGDSAWKVDFGGEVTITSGTVTFTNTTIDIGSALPAGSNTIGAVNLAQYTPNSGRLPVYLGDFIGTQSSTTTHEESIQIGGTTTPGNEWHAAQVTAADPLANANALAVRNLSGTGTPGVSAPTLFNAVAGRDPVTNALRQLDLMVSNPTGTENGVVVRNLPSGTQAVSAASLPLPAGAATAAKQDDLLAELQLKADLTEAQPISAASLPLPTGASTSTIQSNGAQKTQLVDAAGNVITSSTNCIFTCTGTSLDINVKSQDFVIATTTDVQSDPFLRSAFDNSIRVKLADGVDPTHTPPITNAAPASNDYGVAVRNIPGGTQAVSATQLPAALAANGGLKIEGVASGVAVPVSGTVTVNTIAGFSLAATQTDRTQKTQLTDGTRDGTVKAASTLPALSDTAVVTTQRDPLPAGTNVIGHAIIDSGSTSAVTQATGSNLHAVIDSGSTTAVTQATGSNLHAVIDSGAVTATLAAETTKVIGTVNQGTSPWVMSLNQTGANNDVDVLTLPALVAGTAIIGKVGIDQTTPGTTNRVDVGVLPALVAGTAIIGKTGIDQTTPGTTNKVSIGTDGTVAATQSGTWTVMPGNTPNTTPWLVSPPVSNHLNISVRETTAAPTAATWYIKKNWPLPSGGHFSPEAAGASITTALSPTLIGVVNNLGNINVGTNTFTDGNSVAAPRHYGRLFGCVTTILSATPDTITVTYTDDEGATSHTTSAASFPASTPVGNCIEFVLQTSGPTIDGGIRDITGVVDTAATTGVVTLYGLNALGDFPGTAANASEFSTFPGGDELSSTESIFIMMMQAATTAQLRTATVTGTIR